MLHPYPGWVCGLGGGGEWERGCGGVGVGQAARAFTASETRCASAFRRASAAPWARARFEAETGTRHGPPCSVRG
jgi:hypothetical protein